MITWNTNVFLKNKVKTVAESKLNSKIKGENPTRENYKPSILEMSISQIKKYCNEKSNP